MATHTVPAIAGQMGSTRYFQAVMRADELAGTVHAAMDFEEFDSFMASERMQRPISEERVERQIVPYLTNSADRFFGSIIVLVYEPDQFEFEPLKNIGLSGLQGAYREIADNVGALTITGGKLFALDGQHRLHALRTVIAGGTTPRLSLPINGPYANDVRNDTLSVIFLEFSSKEKARRIFNKVNRYAKPTSKATNILISEDDGLSIIARCLASLDDPQKFDSDVDPPLPLLLRNSKATVAIEKNTLSGTDPHLTTLEVLQKSVESIRAATGHPALDESSTIVRPDDSVLRAAYEECAHWWTDLTCTFEPFRSAFKSPSLIPDFRDHGHRHSVAFRPMGQEALIKGMMEAHQLTKMSSSELIDRMNRIDWRLEADLWAGIFLGGGEFQRRIIVRKVPLAATLIAYMLVGPGAYGARRTQELLQRFCAEKAEYGVVRRVLPRPIEA
jgi:DNA sulfur modification protein DndB